MCIEGRIGIYWIFTDLFHQAMSRRRALTVYSTTTIGTETRGDPVPWSVNHVSLLCVASSSQGLLLICWVYSCVLSFHLTIYNLYMGTRWTVYIYPVVDTLSAILLQLHSLHIWLEVLKSCLFFCPFIVIVLGMASSSSVASTPSTFI